METGGMMMKFDPTFQKCITLQNTPAQVWLNFEKISSFDISATTVLHQYTPSNATLYYYVL
jgi:hypothetical protein